MTEPWENNRKDYYQILQVHPSAEPEVITAAYRKLLDKYHPDHNPGREQWANEKSKEINNAYDVLKDHQKRQEFDEERLKKTAKKDNFSQSHNKDFVARSPSPKQSKNEFKNTSNIRDRTGLNIQKVIKNVGKILIVIGIIGAIIGIGTYLFKTKMVQVNTTPIIINKASYYTKRSFWNGAIHYYVQEQWAPNSTTQPKTHYILISNFSSFKVKNNVSWNQLQIHFDTIKTVSNQISQEEYTALAQNSQYTVNIYESRPQHDGIYIVPGILILVLGILIYICSIFDSRRRNFQHGKPEFQSGDNTRGNFTKIRYIPEYASLFLIRNIKQTIAYVIFLVLAIIIIAVVIYGTWLFSLKSWLYALLFIIIVGLPLIIWLVIRYTGWKKKLRIREHVLRRQRALESEIDDYIHKALEIMDTTHKWYTDENEANREFVDCLKAQGLDAEYQPRLSNGTTADARVDDIIIEGKLSPNKADIDRLLGQLIEYAKLNKMVVVVIYGRLDSYSRERIENEIEKRYSKMVFLSYLENPRRNRRN
jgi:curved DNA-binding protein CbpA